MEMERGMGLEMEMGAGGGDGDVDGAGDGDGAGAGDGDTYAIYTPVPFKVLGATSAPMLSESLDRLGRGTSLQHSINIVLLSN